MAKGEAGALGRNESIDIDPVRHPRDLIDLAAQIAFVGAWVIIAPLPVAMAYFLYAALSSWTDPYYAIFLAGLPVFALVLGLFAAAALKGGVGLTLGASGVVVRTVWGGRRLFARWSEVTQVRAVPRREAAFVAAFRFWKMLGGGLTSRDTCALEAGSRWIFIPPRDVALFWQAVHRWWPAITPQPYAGPLIAPAEETGNPYQAPKSDLIELGNDF